MLEPNHKLRLARQEKHWSQDRAAAEIGIDRKTYIRWENGQNYPQPGTLGLACSAFGLSAEELGFTSISSFKGLQEQLSPFWEPHRKRFHQTVYKSNNWNLLRS